MTYRIVNNPINGQPCAVKRLEDGAFIPLDSGNRDYDEFMAWNSIPGNEPLPADPPGA